jgi:hypothetical protein
LRPAYDIVVCGSGPGGSVAARRLAENSDAQVLLVEAGGSDDADAVAEPSMWPTNIGSERDWSFVGETNPLINGRSIPLPMGKVLGGSSSINLMAWARGHRRDWDLFAAESGETAWRYDAVLELYRSIEDWHGKPDPHFRGVGGPVFVAPANDPHPAAHAAVDAARSLGIPTFDNANGEVMQSATGASIGDLRIRNGLRESVYQSYIRPHLGRENLTVLTRAEVQRLVFRGRRVIGVEIIHRGQRQTITATTEVVLSMGAVNTPKVLMVSGLGDSGELRALGIPVVEDLPGVGRNFQDHVAFDLVWEDDGTHTDFTCTTCHHEGEIYRRGQCARCAPRDDPCKILLHHPADLTAMQTLIEVLCGVDRPESILTWKHNIQVLELLGGITSGAIPLTHDGLTAAGSGRHIDHLRSLLQHHGLLPQRDEHLARFEVWLANKLDAIDSPTVRAPVEQFATWHHLRRLRSESRPGQSSDGPKRSAKQEITETIKFLTWLEQTHRRTVTDCTQQDVDEYLASGPTTRHLIRTFFVWAKKSKLNVAVQIVFRQAKTTPTITQDQRLAWLKELLRSHRKPAVVGRDRCTRFRS